MEKRYATDAAKAKSRDMVRDFIKTHLAYRKPKDIEVICFPGIDAQEILDVYDPLGIPRENITGLEMVPSIYRELQQKKLGIKLVNASLQDFVEREQTLNYDVLSFDFTGPVSSDIQFAYAQICEKQKKQSFVLHAANLAKRDRQSYGLYAACDIYRGADVAHEEKRGQTSMQQFLASIEGAKKQVEEIGQKLQNGDSFNDVRSRSYSYLLTGAFSGETDAALKKRIKYVITCDGQTPYETGLRKLEQMMRGRIQMDGVTIDSENPYGSLMTRPVARYFMVRMARLFLEKNCEFIGLKMNPELAASIHDALEIWTRDKFYYPKNRNRYLYVSESGSPMIGDVVLFGNPKGIIASTGDIMHALGFPGRIKISSIKDLNAALSRNSREIRSFYGAHLENIVSEDLMQPNRDFLGNASRPVLNRERYLDLRTKGVSAEEIKLQFRGWKTGRVSAWEAHRTMGTYVRKSESPSVVVQHIEVENKPKVDDKTQIENKNTLSKDDAISLLKTGFTVEEIAKEYPDSFTPGTLRSLKAWITIREKKSATVQVV